MIFSVEQTVEYEKSASPILLFAKREEGVSHDRQSFF